MESSRKLKNLSRTEISEEIKKQSLISNFGKLYLYLVETFGYPRKTQKNIGKREGQEVQLNFMALKNKFNPSGAILVMLSKTKLNLQLGSSENAKALIKFQMDEDEILPTICEIIKMKANCWGLLKIILKFIIPGKIRFKGSLFAAMRATLLMMVGKHPMYKKSNINPQFIQNIN